MASKATGKVQQRLQRKVKLYEQALQQLEEFFMYQYGDIMDKEEVDAILDNLEAELNGRPWS